MAGTGNLTHKAQCRPPGKLLTHPSSKQLEVTILINYLVIKGFDLRQHCFLTTTLVKYFKNHHISIRIAGSNMPTHYFTSKSPKLKIRSACWCKGNHLQFEIPTTPTTFVPSLLSTCDEQA